MKTLLIYFILNHACQWEFLAIEHVEDRSYCQHLSDVVHEQNTLHGIKIGNMEIVCSKDQGREL